MSWRPILAALVPIVLASGCGTEDEVVGVQGDRELVGWRVSYDARGLPREKVDARNARVRYAFEEHPGGTRVRVEPDGETALVAELDAFGAVTSVADGFGQAEYAYDAYRRLRAVTRNGVQEIAYGYNPDGQVTSVDLSGWSVRYKYDFLGRLSAVESQLGAVTYQCNPSTREITRTMPSGVISVFRYGADGALLCLTHADSNRRVLAEFACERQPGGRIRRERELVLGRESNVDYEYDGAGRLVEVDAADPIAYEYDPLGNRTACQSAAGSVHGVPDGRSRLQSWGGVSFEYDPAGLLIRRTEAGAKTEYQYTTEHQLACVRNVRSALDVEYRCDGHGRLRSRRSGSRETEYIVDALTDEWRPWAARSRTSNVNYLWSDGLLGFAEDGRFTCCLEDLRGSIRVLVGPDGSTRTLGYSPFGSWMGPAPDPNGDLEPGFAGLFYDPALHAYLVGPRTYDPELGRFNEPEPLFPLLFASGVVVNPYAYCEGDPVNWVDLNGLYPQAPRTGMGWPATWPGPNSPFSPFGPLGPFAGLPSPASPPWGTSGPGSNMTGGDSFDPFSEPRLDLMEFAGDAASDIGLGLVGLHWPLVEAAGTGIGGTLGVLDALDDLSAHPGDPSGGVGLAASAAGLASALVPGFGGLALGAAGAAADLANKVGKLIRSALLQDRAQGLMRLGRGLGPLHITGSVGTRGGTFHASDLGGRYRADGAWSLHHGLRGGARFDAYAHEQLKLENARRFDGARVSGRIQREIGRSETESSSLTRTRTSERYTVSYDGAAVSRAVDAWNAHGGDASSGTDHDGNTHLPMASRDGGGSDGPGGGGPTMAPPSTVGGVYLGAEGLDLSGLDVLRGVVIDSSCGDWILVGEKEGTGQVAVPDLRLDDVVAVFRSVYERGEAPWVTIDPDSVDPTGDVMRVKYGPEMAGTWAGRTLFESDRVMKVYNSGADNVTGAIVFSQIPGYSDLFRSAGRFDDSIWERFWIVPEQLLIRQASNASLFDLSLGVQTQVMRLMHGRLVPTDRHPSDRARAFIDWFGDSYRRVGDEVAARKSNEAGAAPQTNVFRELERLAVVSAIAQSLHSRGVPMPVWMRTHVPAKLETPTETPAIRVLHPEQTDARILSRAEYEHKQFAGLAIYGGVNLMSESNRTRTIGRDPEAERLAHAVHLRARDRRSTLPRGQFTVEGTQYQTISLPGANSRDLGAMVLQQVDLEVDYGALIPLRLERRWSSFASPSEVAADKWTFDLPTLAPEWLAREKTGDQTALERTYTLMSPLGALSVAFVERSFVSELGIEALKPSNTAEILGIVSSPRPGAEVAVVFRDGRWWHFDAAGHLVEAQSGGRSTTYRWGAHGELTAVERQHGGRGMATIRLEYDVGAGRLLRAVGSDGSTVEYVYDALGRLESVQNGKTIRFRYAYEGQVLRSAATPFGSATFRFDERGHLAAWEDEAGRVHSREIVRDSSTVTIRERAGEAADVEREARYDRDWRPAFERFADRSTIVWEYGPSGESEAVVTGVSGATYHLRVSADGCERVLSAPTGLVLRQMDDPIHRTYAVYVNQDLMARVEWAGDGSLRDIWTWKHRVHLEPRPDGGRRILITPPTEQTQYDEWVEVQIDRDGQVEGVRDAEGRQFEVKYRPNGFSVRGSDFSADLESTPTQRTVRLVAGDRTVLAEYDESGVVLRDDAGADVRARFHDGRIYQIEDRSWGRASLSFDQTAGAGLPRRVERTGVPTLEFERAGARLSRVRVGGSYSLEWERDERGRATACFYRGGS